MSLATGTRIGAYHVVAKLGAGGMGEVYRARDTKLDRDVAIKILPESFASDADRVMRFEREAKTLASLNHPHIAQIHGFEQSGGTSALVMELVDGEDLSQRIARGPIPLDEALPIAKQIAEALEAAHDAGIVHRDLKPGNVKLKDDGTIKVLDFGLAKAAHPAATGATITSPAMTMQGVVLGTAAYMAPEQARGRAVDRRADIWAFGVIVFEMLSGRPAFADEDISMTLSNVLQREPDFAALPAEVPSRVTQTLRVCLRKDPKQRASDIRDVRLALDGAFESTAAEVSTVKAVSPLRIGIWIASGLVAGVVLGLGLSPLFRSPVPRSQTLRLDIMPAADRPINLRSTLLSLALSPDNTFVAYATGSTTEMVVRYFDRLEASPLSGTTGAIPVAVSPDSRWILFAADGQLKKVPASGGTPILVCALSGPLFGASWGIDNQIFFAAGNSDGVQTVSADGGKLAAITKPEFDKGDQFHHFPLALPRRNTLVVTVSSESGTRLESRDLEDGQTKLLVPGGSQAVYLDAGYLVYVLSDALWASRFDLTRLELVGDPVPIRDRVGIVSSPSSMVSRALYAASSGGTMVYVPVEAMPRIGERSVMWVDRNGAEEAIPVPVRPYNYARLSPDGSRIALSHSGDIWLWSRTGQTLTRLTFDPANDSYPVWAPDGQRVIFASTRGGVANVWWQRVDGTGSTERLTNSPHAQTPLGVSSDGQLVLREDHRESRNLAVLKLGGTAKVQTLLELPNRENNADLSPDGRWLAYQSSEGGGTGDEVFVRPFPDVNGGRWQISNGQSAKPRWSRDGRELFFLSYKTNTLSSVSVSPGSTFSAGPITPVLKDVNRYFNTVPARPWDVSADGERFLMIKEAAGPQLTALKLVVVTNWVEELKQP